MSSADAIAMSVPNDGATRPSSTMLTIAAVRPERAATMSKVSCWPCRVLRSLLPTARNISSVSMLIVVVRRVAWARPRRGRMSEVVIGAPERTGGSPHGVHQGPGRGDSRTRLRAGRRAQEPRRRVSQIVKYHFKSDKACLSDAACGRWSARCSRRPAAEYAGYRDSGIRLDRAVAPVARADHAGPHPSHCCRAPRLRQGPRRDADRATASSTTTRACGCWPCSARSTGPRPRRSNRTTTTTTMATVNTAVRNVTTAQRAASTPASARPSGSSARRWVGSCTSGAARATSAPSPAD